MLGHLQLIIMDWKRIECCNFNQFPSNSWSAATSSWSVLFASGSPVKVLPYTFQVFFLQPSLRQKAMTQTGTCLGWEHVCHVWAGSTSEKVLEDNEEALWKILRMIELPCASNNHYPVDGKHIKYIKTRKTAFSQRNKVSRANIKVPVIMHIRTSYIHREIRYTNKTEETCRNMLKENWKTAYVVIFPVYPRKFILQSTCGSEEFFLFPTGHSLSISEGEIFCCGKISRRG